MMMMMKTPSVVFGRGGSDGAKTRARARKKTTTTVWGGGRVRALGRFAARDGGQMLLCVRCVVPGTIIN